MRPDLNQPLAEIGLEIGQVVRYLGKADRRYREGVVMRRESDGSVGLRDERGRSRAIPIDAIEVLVVGPRGDEKWVPLVDQGGGMQLGLFSG